MKQKGAFSLFNVVAENLGNNELGLKTKKKDESLKKKESESENLVSNQIKNKIKEFHDYLNEGISLDKAKKLIFDSTVYHEVKQYVADYVAANQNFSLDINQYSQPEKSKNCKCRGELANLIHEINNLGITVSSFNRNFETEKKAIQDKLFALMKDH